MLFLLALPEIVKIYKGGENFDGSILTKLIRQIGANEKSETGAILKWLSDKCKVPYDLSAVKGVIYPQNHRLRSLSHDPYFGLFFAVADIILGTTTCIDNDGKLRVILNYDVSITEKLLSVIYYIGHILSDICTARGIPIPGFFLTQFFTENGTNESIASIAQKMYLDGYDMRHLVSMSVSVVVKNIVIEAYLRLTRENINELLPVADKERAKINYNLKREKMLFIANAIASGGNIIKFVAPPNCSNPCALNVAQWFAMIRSSIAMIKASFRDKTTETLMDNRTLINQMWDNLLGDKES